METNAESAGVAADASTLTRISTNSQSEARLRSLAAERGRPLRIRVEGSTDFDLSAHQAGTAPLTLRVLDEDDTEGHAISLHFPTAEETKHFEQRMLATGAIVGTLVIAGSGLALSQALPDAGAPANQAQVQAPAQASLPAGMTGKEAAVLQEIAGTDAVDLGQATVSPTTANLISSGKGQAILDEMAGSERNEE